MSPTEILNINGPVIALLGVLVTVAANYIIQKKKSDSDIYVTDKTILRQDQQEFKESILEELRECREIADRLRSENDDLHKRALDDKEDKLKLSLEILDLQKQIIELKKHIDSIMKRVEQ